MQTSSKICSGRSWGKKFAGDHRAGWLPFSFSASLDRDLPFKIITVLITRRKRLQNDRCPWTLSTCEGLPVMFPP